MGPAKYSFLEVDLGHSLPSAESKRAVISYNVLAKECALTTG